MATTISRGVGANLSNEAKTSSVNRGTGSAGNDREGGIDDLDNGVDACGTGAGTNNARSNSSEWRTGSLTEGRVKMGLRWESTQQVRNSLLTRQTCDPL